MGNSGKITDVRPGARNARNRRQFKARLFVLAVLLITSSRPPAVAQSNVQDIEAELRTRYKDKLINIKMFASGSTLHFDQLGNLTRGGNVGTWTLYAGQLITGITVKRGFLRIEGPRVLYINENATGRLSPVRSSIGRSIEIDLPPDLSLPAVDRTISRVFIGAEGLAPYVPDYWKKYLLREAGQLTDTFECDKSETLSALIGRTAPSRPVPTNPTSVNITAANLLKKVNPKFPKEAMELRIQGVVGLDAVISETGDVSELHITHPIGGSLDENAFDAVRQWKYSPTLADGKPVPVQTCLTVNYQIAR